MSISPINKNYEKFRKILDERALLTDGAMGTEIYNKGIFINKCYENLNLDEDNRGIIKSIHESYINAGADINISNTYGANRIRLSLHGLTDKIEAINHNGIQILIDLRDNGEKFFFIGGSVGATGAYSGNIAKIDTEKVYLAFKEQIKYLIEAGADLISFESFNSLPELELAIKATRNVSPEIPIIAMMTFPNKNETIFGNTVKTVAKKLSTLDIDVIGVNCSTGPQRALDLLKEFIANTDKKTIVMPNAGYPQRIDGRMLYMSNTELFGTYATKFLENGASIIGGCCGTTPEFISQMHKSLRQQYPALRKSSSVVNTKEETSVVNEFLTPIQIEKRSELSKLLFSNTEKKEENRKILSMEILPPKSPIISKTIEIVNSFEDKFDLVNIPDGPRASSRMAISTTSYLIEKNCKNVETITHYCCRDRNILGIQSDLLAMHALGLRNILAITGDPPKLGDYPNVTAVFDVDAIGLVKIIADLNKGLDIVGNFIGEQTSFLIGVGANPTADNMEREISRLEEKIEAGAEYIMTQPVYEVKQFLDFYEKIKRFNKPIIIGISPLTSYKSAHFQHHEIPGMQIPEDLLERLRLSKDKKEAREIGVSVAVKLIDEVYEKISGVYFMAQGIIGRKLSSKIVDRSKLQHI